MDTEYSTADANNAVPCSQLLRDRLNSSTQYLKNAWSFVC